MRVSKQTEHFEHYWAIFIIVFSWRRPSDWNVLYLFVTAIHIAQDNFLIPILIAIILIHARSIRNSMYYARGFVTNNLTSNNKSVCSHPIIHGRFMNIIWMCHSNTVPLKQIILLRLCEKIAVYTCRRNPIRWNQRKRKWESALKIYSLCMVVEHHHNNSL